MVQIIDSPLKKKVLTKLREQHKEKPKIPLGRISQVQTTQNEGTPIETNNNMKGLKG